ncbi:heat shock protein HSP 90-alpha A2-like [Macrobrachium rosenbergii]|uniref:heat shock protein HSP 90-alpha A2-like n=1 Tax=Macrobrachium rosenbergii TaxID=79674 RepID=UPI0034D3A650
MSVALYITNLRSLWRSDVIEEIRRRRKVMSRDPQVEKRCHRRDSQEEEEKKSDPQVEKRCHQKDSQEEEEKNVPQVEKLCHRKDLQEEKKNVPQVEKRCHRKYSQEKKKSDVKGLVDRSHESYSKVHAHKCCRIC